MQAETTAFTDAVRAGDIEAAKAAYPVSRRSWERIEPIAGLIEDIDTAVDAREDDYDGPTTRRSPAGTASSTCCGRPATSSEAGPIADQLDADLQTLADAAPDARAPAGRAHRRRPGADRGGRRARRQALRRGGPLLAAPTCTTSWPTSRAPRRSSTCSPRRSRRPIPSCWRRSASSSPTLYEHLAELGSFEDGFVPLRRGDPGAEGRAGRRPRRRWPSRCRCSTARSDWSEPATRASAARAGDRSSLAPRSRGRRRRHRCRGGGRACTRRRCRRRSRLRAEAPPARRSPRRRSAAPRQAGVIAAPAAAGVVAAGLDVRVADRARLIELLRGRQHGDRAGHERRARTSGAPAGSPRSTPASSGRSPGPTGTSIILGLGASLFDDRYGLADAAPAGAGPDAPLPPTTGWSMPERSHGDVSLVVQADTRGRRQPRRCARCCGGRVASWRCAGCARASTRSTRRAGARARRRRAT